ncbi:MAG: hypothetical protein JWO82_122 [Akkermansiaceae bacterium]|nr:hypothetical protein [Akkermansiaceae bacterium]
MRLLCTAAIGLFALTAATFADPAADAEKLVTLAFGSSALEGAKAAFATFL